MNYFNGLDPWKFVAGLGIFLMAMALIEASLKELAGRRFKQFFREYTKTPLRGVFAGTFSTAVLQSSSVVTLMVLSFVGAGIIELRSALGVIFGSNLGTTFTGWVVATIGFKFDLQSLCYPLIGVGALFYTIIPKHKMMAQFFRFLAGLGLLFLGLDFMKQAMAALSENFDIATLAGHSIFIYFLFGYILTAIIQSSSATMMILLTALNAGVITLPIAAAAIIGADLGTTITALFAGFFGKAEKKQVALAHFIFNLVTDVLALLMLPILLSFAVFVFGTDNPLMSLVLFHSTFNVIGILLFLPFTKRFAQFLQRKFSFSNEELFNYINRVNPSVPEAAVEALNREFEILISNVQSHNLQALNINRRISNFAMVYENLKVKLGSILEFILRVQEQAVAKDESIRLNQLLKALDQLSRSAKSAKDIHHNMQSFENSARPHIIKFQNLLDKQIRKFYCKVDELLKFNNQSHLFEELKLLTKMINKTQEDLQQSIYTFALNEELDENTISTLLNVNRELHNSSRSFILSIKDILLSPEKSEEV